MTNQKIKEAIDYYNNNKICQHEWLKPVIDLAQSVLDAKMPEEEKGLVFLSSKELKLTDKLIEGRTLEDWIKYGYNLALSDFRIWQAKCLSNLEKVIQNKLGLLNENKIKELAETIRNLFGGEE